MSEKPKKAKVAKALELDPAAPEESDDDKLSKPERAARAMAHWPPTARDLRAWMDQHGLSNKDVAKALKLSDGRVVRFWTAKKSPRRIPYPSWYTIKHKFSAEPKD
jgi:DNA-directed RNA polymerase specialized sigma24 family protein